MRTADGTLPQRAGRLLAKLEQFLAWQPTPATTADEARVAQAFARVLLAVAKAQVREEQAKQHPPASATETTNSLGQEAAPGIQ